MWEIPELLFMEDKVPAHNYKHHYHIKAQEEL